MGEKKLYLFTLSFPYYIGGENSFLQVELEHLENEFTSIVIIPLNIGGERQEISSNIIVEQSLAEYVNINKKSTIKILVKGLMSMTFVKEIIQKPFLLFSFDTFKSTIAYIGNAIRIREWAQEYFDKSKIANTQIILYTYWCNQITLGLGLFKRNFSNVKLVTRAHGIDLFEERGSVFCQRQTVMKVERFYLVSESGFNYLSSKFPDYISSFKLSGLGVRSLGIVTKVSNDGCFRIVSCSNVDMNKRVDLIYKALLIVSKSLPELQFIWVHFGDGPLKSELETYIFHNSADKVRVVFKGKVTNQEILQFYEYNPVDVFISTSASEGGRPVSMQEAQSYGIPLIGTNVGGIPEIINDSVGILLNSNPSPEEISRSLIWFIHNKKVVRDMKIASLENWMYNFNADINYKAFTHDLLELF